VGSDLPEEADMPPDGHADRQDDQAGAARSARPDPAEPETRDRQEYYADLRKAVSTEESVTAQRITAEEQDASDKWNERVTESRWMWSEYQRKWPPEERPLVYRSDDDPEISARVEAACDRIADLERDKISPAMRAIENQDPSRHLIGFDNRLKGHDRIKQKVFDKMEEFGFSPEEATSNVSDTIRYTFEYREAYYTQGVWSDISRLKDEGFQLHILKNDWSAEQYKGINSQWIEPQSGQRFEVQFHTPISFEAKQLTHDAYERLRTHQADKFEELVLEAIQKKVSGEVSVPPGATDIPDYPERGRDAR
jgi:hypothetical protein